MINENNSGFVSLITVIVNDGMGSKILKTAKKYGIFGGTLTLAKGTVCKSIWDILGLSDSKKEILYMVADKETAYSAMDNISKIYKFQKKNHGIAYITNVCATKGTHSCKCIHKKEERGEKSMYQVLTIIVEKGNAEDVILAATKMGSKGGTIINARGSGIHETSKVFSMDIEPEKEVVLILSEIDKTEAIVESIRKELRIDEPGRGIIYVQDVDKTYGLYK